MNSTRATELQARAEKKAARQAKKAAEANDGPQSQTVVWAEGPSDFVHELTERIGMFNQKFLDDLHEVFDF